eukprot:10278.XXX_578230_578481_1 [CDS] Oithona nana genome sequencing.
MFLRLGILLGVLSGVQGSPATAESMALTAPELEATSTVSTTPKPILCRNPCTSNGYCDSKTGKCVCYPGWSGDRCHLCGGKIK